MRLSRFRRLRRLRPAGRRTWRDRSGRSRGAAKRGRDWRATSWVGAGPTCGVRTASAARTRRGMPVASTGRGKSSACGSCDGERPGTWSRWTRRDRVALVWAARRRTRSVCSFEPLKTCTRPSGRVARPRSNRESPVDESSRRHTRTGRAGECTHAVDPGLHDLLRPP